MTVWQCSRGALLTADSTVHLLSSTLSLSLLQYSLCITLSHQKYFYSWFIFDWIPFVSDFTSLGRMDGWYSIKKSKEMDFSNLFLKKRIHNKNIIFYKWFYFVCSWNSYWVLQRKYNGTSGKRLRHSHSTGNQLAEFQN